MLLLLWVVTILARHVWVDSSGSWKPLRVTLFVAYELHVWDRRCFTVSAWLLTHHWNGWVGIDNSLIGVGILRVEGGRYEFRSVQVKVLYLLSGLRRLSHRGRSRKLRLRHGCILLVRSALVLADFGLGRVLLLERDISSGPWEWCLFDAAHKVLILVHISQVRHVVVRREVYNPCFREHLEPMLQCLPLVEVVMIVGAMRLSAGVSVLARVKFVVLGMILLLLPTMTVRAPVLIRTTVFVLIDELSWSPIGTLILGVDIELRLPSEVLPVMSEHTLVPLVFGFVVGTPYGFEVEHVEVRVHFELVDQFHRNLGLGMCEWAEVAVLTLAGAVDVGGAKLGLVLIRVVKLLHPVVRLLTIVPFQTFLAMYRVLTHFRLVRS